MLVEFSVENYRSIYNKVTLSMEAVTKNELDDHIREISHQRLLKTGVIYGANASGKSNIFKAFSFMKNMVLNSFKESQIGEPILVEPFLLNSMGKDEPSSFEVIFLIDDVLYRYGFSAFRDHIAREWLFIRKTIPRVREIVLFGRLGQDIQVHSQFKEGKGEVKDKLRENSLFISLLAQFNGKIAIKIVKCFLDSNLWSMDAYYPIPTTILLDNNVVPLEWVNEFMQKADTDIKEIRINEQEMERDMRINIPISSIILKGKENKMVTLSIKTIHQFYDPKEDVLKEVEFDMEKQESEGTKKFYCLAGLLYDTLKRGGRLFIDEIENSLHPFLIRIIIRLFQDKEANPKGAQLIFTTQNTLFLNKDNFRRDEIWFVEKAPDHSSDLYSLVEYKLPKGSARKDASYAKDYIRGKYGAVPYVEYADFAELFKKSRERTKNEQN